MTVRITAVLLLVVYVHTEEGKHLDALIGEGLKKQDDASTQTSSSSISSPSTLHFQPNSGSSSAVTDICTCVPYYLCKNSTINSNKEGIIDIIIDQKPCESYIEVCCNKENQVNEPITPAPPPGRMTEGCGHRNPDGIGFPLTGDKENEAQFGEFPWMVAILREESVEGNPLKLNVYQCGGALIHPQVVVTGAHCVSGKNKAFKIRAGEWDTQHTKELLPHQDREVQSISIHPQYYAGALYNDIALLFLKSPVTVAENVNVVCLPPANMVVEAEKCYTTGWGKDVFGKEGKYQVILKKDDFPIVLRNICQTKLRETRLGAHFELHRSFICAGGDPKKDTCRGDGGSPLVCPIGGKGERYFQAGILSWGINCGQNGVPGVYVNVALFRDWIDAQFNANNLKLSGYQY